MPPIAMVLSGAGSTGSRRLSAAMAEAEAEAQEAKEKESEERRSLKFASPRASGSFKPGSRDEAVLNSSMDPSSTPSIETHQAEIERAPMTSAFDNELQQARADAAKKDGNHTTLEVHLRAAKEWLQNDKILVELRMLEVESAHRRHMRRFNHQGDVHWSEDERSTAGSADRKGDRKERDSARGLYVIDEAPPTAMRRLRGLGWALRGRVAPTLSRQDSSRSSPGSSVGGFSPRMAQNNSNLSLADMAAPPEEEAASTREQILDILALAKLGMWNFMSEPDSSTGAYITSLLLLAAIAMSSVAFCMETMENEFGDDASIAAFAHVEVVCVAVFSVEYFIKLVCCSQVWPFVRAPMNLVDLVAILPFYVELIGSGIGSLDTRIIRIMRLVRVFRVLKLGGRYGKMQVVVKAVNESADMLVMMVFLLALCIIIFSSLVFFSERGAWDDSLQRFVRPDELNFDPLDHPIPSPFPDIPRSFWWCMVTLMTVGYGDVVPITVLGKCVAAAAMVVSVLIMALPISVIGTHFSNQWMEYKDAVSTGGKENKDGAPYFEKLLADFKEHYFLMDEIAKKVTEIEDPILKPIMRLEERCKKQRAMHHMQEAKLKESEQDRAQSAWTATTAAADEAGEEGIHTSTRSQGSAKGGVHDAVESIRKREVAENQRLMGEMKKHDHKVYQYVMMMETLLANDDVKLLMEKLTLNNQVFEVLVNENESLEAELAELRLRRSGANASAKDKSIFDLQHLGSLGSTPLGVLVHGLGHGLEGVAQGLGHGLDSVAHGLGQGMEGLSHGLEDLSEGAEDLMHRTKQMLSRAMTVR